MATNPQQDARDFLDEATAMMEFMIEISPALDASGLSVGITANAAFGLGLIFDHINKTIGQARALI